MHYKTCWVANQLAQMDAATHAYIYIFSPIANFSYLTHLLHSLHSQATGLNCGFNCADKCHLCDGGDWHIVTRDAEWRGSLWGQRRKSPFKRKRNPMLSIPGVVAHRILPDSCHCCHLGWGIDFAASGLVLLAKRGWFGHGVLDVCLHSAYKAFLQWVSANKKTTGIDWWSYKKLDMSSNLNRN